jgi:rod shape determining protein RodA
MAITTRPREGPAILQRERSLRPDLILVLAYLALAGVGILMVYTASAPRLIAEGLDPASLMRRHAIFVVVGIVAFIASSLIDNRSLRLLTPPIYIGSIVALLLVLTPLGDFRKGANRWIALGPFQLQPSEFAKVAVILALAALLAGAVGGALRWYHLMRAGIIVGVPAVLIFLQPDLGTMLVLAFIGAIMLFVAGTTWRQLAFLILASVVGSVALFQVNALKTYQLTRLVAFLDPSADLAETALYNQLQSKIAIGSGGFFGKGLFQGTQTNLNFVPEQATDFIFTAVGEQLGFLGGLLVLALYAVILWRLLVAAMNGRDHFSQLLAVGVAAFMVFHVFVNVGMTLQIMPVTGLPLPFLSSGGSAFLAMSIALGLGHSVWMRRSPVPGERKIL